MKKHCWRNEYRGPQSITYNAYRDVFTGIHYATLSGCEFPNTYGQGKSEKEAVLSLQLRVTQLRNKADNVHQF